MAWFLGGDFTRRLNRMGALDIETFTVDGRSYVVMLEETANLMAEGVIKIRPKPRDGVVPSSGT